MRISKMLSLQNRVSVVTGATGYIGKTIWDVLCKFGSEIFAIDNNEEELRKLKEKLEKETDYTISIQVEK